MSADLESTTVVALRAAGRRVDKRWLFRDLTLSIRPGDFVCLSGANGSGKSVLLRSFCGLEPLDEGELLWQDVPVPDHQMPRLRRHVLYVAQRPHLLGATLRHSLVEAASFHVAVAEPAADQQLESVLASLDRPPEFADLTADRMSGGELLLAALAQALTLNPQALLLDEPTAALDDATRGIVEQRVKAWREETSARAVVWVTHDERQAERLAATRWRLADGQLAEVSPATEEEAM